MDPRREAERELRREARFTAESQFSFAHLKSCKDAAHNFLCHTLAPAANFLLEMIGRVENLGLKFRDMRLHLWLRGAGQLWLELAEVVCRSAAVSSLDDLLGVHVELCLQGQFSQQRYDDASHRQGLI